MQEVIRIQQLLKSLVQGMVATPQSVQVHVSTEAESVTFSVGVETQDLGKIIGRGGRIAQSLRCIFRAIGAEAGLRVRLDLVTTEELGRDF